MYYYIMDTPKNISQRRTQEKIKDILGFLGIAGETVTVSPARSVEELTNMGLAKKYSTIVAVGGDLLINKIASVLQEKETVLGIIPLGASPIIHQVIGTDNLKTACESLRYRRIKNIDLAYIEPNKYFLTKAEIKSEKPLICQIEVDNCEFRSTATQIELSADLTLMIKDETLNPGPLGHAWDWLWGKKTVEPGISIFKGRRIRIEPLESLPVSVGEEIIAKTPIIARLKPRVLKIIISRDKMEEK